MERLKIAIAGGGIASLCLAHSLTANNPDWEVKIFEASPQLREEGAAIGLAINAQEALRLISPSLREALDEAGGVLCVPSARIMVGTGPNAGTHAGDLDQESSQITVHRTAFWNALRKRLPDHVLEWGKKLASIDETVQDTVQLTFSDGTIYSCHALIGCDGINSTVREYILGADHPAAKPIFTGGYNHRVVVPLAEAEAAFGKEYCDIRTQMGWIGEGGFLLTDHNVYGGDPSMQVIAGWSSKGPWPYETPFVEWDKERIKKDMEGWGEIGEKMLKIFLSQKPLYAAASRIHAPTPTYSKGPICIAGDAAQAFPPAQGAGAGQAIEDALMLSTVLNTLPSSHPDTASLTRAFKVYDTLRRPRRSAIAESSLWAGRVLTGRAPEIGVDLERIREMLPRFHGEIFGVDLEGVQREAVEMMEKGKSDV